MNSGWASGPSQPSYIDQYSTQKNHGVVGDGDELSRILSNVLSADYVLEPFNQQALDALADPPIGTNFDLLPPAQPTPGYYSRSQQQSEYYPQYDSTQLQHLPNNLLPNNGSYNGSYVYSQYSEPYHANHSVAASGSLVSNEALRPTAAQQTIQHTQHPVPSSQLDSARPAPPAPPLANIREYNQPNMMQPLHFNADQGHHIMPTTQLLRPEESTAVTGLNMMATGSPNSFAGLRTAAASTSVGPLSRPVSSVTPPEYSGRPEPFPPSSHSSRPATSSSPPEFSGRPEPPVPASLAAHTSGPATSSSITPPDVPAGFLGLGISTTKSLRDSSQLLSASPGATTNQLESLSLHTETQSVAVNTTKISTKPMNASSKADTKGIPRNKPGVVSSKMSPHNQYNSKGRTKAYSLFGKFSEVSTEINARVEQQMREHNYDYTKRVALLNKERQAEFEKLPAEAQQSWIKRMEMENESSRGLTEDFEERMSSIGHRVGLLHEDTYEVSGVPILSVIFRPPNEIHRASAHIMQAAGPFTGFTTWLEKSYGIREKTVLFRFLDDYANYLYSLANELKPSFTPDLPTPLEVTAPYDSAGAQDSDQEPDDKKKRKRKNKFKPEVKPHLGPIWRDGIQHISDPRNLDVTVARKTLRTALQQRWEAAGRQGRMIFAYIEDTPWEYVRENSLPPGLHLKKIEHIPLEHIKRLLDHLRSLESDETYEDGLIFISKYEGLPKVRHRKSKKQKLMEMDRLPPVGSLGDQESEQGSEFEFEEKPSPPASAIALPTTEVDEPKVQRNAAHPGSEGRLTNGNVQRPDFDPTSSKTDTTQTTHSPHSQSKLSGSTPMNTSTVIEMGSLFRQSEVSSHLSLSPICGQSGVNPSQLSLSRGPKQSGEHAELSFGSGDGSSSMQEKATQLSSSSPFPAVPPSQFTSQGTSLVQSSGATLGLNEQGIKNGSTSASPRCEGHGMPPGHDGQTPSLDNKLSSVVGDVNGSNPLEMVVVETSAFGKGSGQSVIADGVSFHEGLIVSRTGSPHSAGTSPPTATVPSSPDNDGDAHAHAHGERVEDEVVDPSCHSNPPPPSGNQGPEDQEQGGPSFHHDPPPPPAGPTGKGPKKSQGIKAPAKALKGPAKKFTPKFLDKPRPATRSSTSKKRGREDSDRHPNKKPRM